MVTGLDLDDRLSPRALDHVLTALRFRDEDAAAVRQLAPEILGDADTRVRVQQQASALIDLAGDYLAPPLFQDADAAHPLGFGVPTIYAFLATYPEAITWRPGQPLDLVHASLADLGQQIHVHRLVRHEFGLHALGWVQSNWAGGLVWLDRLQFDVERLPIDVPGRSKGEAAWWIHIPRGGP